MVRCSDLSLCAVLPLLQAPRRFYPRCQHEPCHKHPAIASRCVGAQELLAAALYVAASLHLFSDPGGLCQTMKTHPYQPTTEQLVWKLLHAPLSDGFLAAGLCCCSCCCCSTLPLILAAAAAAAAAVKTTSLPGCVPATRCSGPLCPTVKGCRAVETLLPAYVITCHCREDN